MSLYKGGYKINSNIGSSEGKIPKIFVWGSNVRATVNYVGDVHMLRHEAFKSSIISDELEHGLLYKLHISRCYHCQSERKTSILSHY